MSSISSTSSTLQAMMGQQVGKSKPSGGPPPQGGGGRVDMKSQVESAAKAAGLDSTEITELHSQLQEAMETSKSEGLTREESIAAFDSILEENGIDVESFKSGIESLMQSTGQAPPPPPPSSTNEDEDDDESSFNITAEEFVDMMSNLPSGSLINAVA